MRAVQELLQQTGCPQMAWSNQVARARRHRHVFDKRLMRWRLNVARVFCIRLRPFLQPHAFHHEVLRSNLVVLCIDAPLSYSRCGHLRQTKHGSDSVLHCLRVRLVLAF